jgi:hypothetical protein
MFLHKLAAAARRGHYVARFVTKFSAVQQEAERLMERRFG